MMGDNPPSFTTVEQLGNHFSPSRRKNDFSAASSSTSSPAMMRSPILKFSSPRGNSTQKVVTIFDQIRDWFHSEIDQRKRVAGFVCGYLSVISFVLTVSVLKFSIWSPFSSVYDSLTWWLYPSEWIPMIFVGLASTAIVLAIIFYLCKVNQVPRIPVTDTLAWTGVLLDFWNFIFLGFRMDRNFVITDDIISSCRVSKRFPSQFFGYSSE
uniref:Transmembrane protein n=1 Tax=Caenorhabditis japonica TaxID=281687 RepID=A0A8R1HMK1_CAEJA